ncbi:metallophosphoesterase [Promineifilum sp.]|uniref:metallophosphoesterase family protein n=1 Tax=Promineifilum sp. TaxID=2664178 RepID=UPI0035B0F45E
MQVALISDIHGNLTALDAALTDIARHGADQIICLGDVAALGPQPMAVVHRLHDLAIPVILGNTDHWLLNPKREKTKNDDQRRQQEIELWAAGQVTATERGLIEAYAPWLAFNLDGTSLLCYHGSPRSFEERIEPETPTKKLDDYFEEHRATLLAGGHTHEAMVRRYGESVIINPGSVGLPMIHPQPGSEKNTYNPPWAEYALVDTHDGGLTLSLRRVPYSLDDLAAAVRASGMPHADFYLADWK